MQRRQFFRSGLAAGAGLALTAAGLPAIEPIRRNGKPHLRLSLAASSAESGLTERSHPSACRRGSTCSMKRTGVPVQGFPEVDAVRISKIPRERKKKTSNAWKKLNCPSTNGT